jgi:hypothetical protein
MPEATWPGAVRSRKVCTFWLIFTFVSILCLVFLDNYTHHEFALDYRVLFSLVALFSAQAFLAEVIGLRADARGVSFPRRLFAHLGFPTLWRRRIALKDISRADSLDERTVRFHLFSTELVDVLFPDIMSRRSFLRYIGKELARSVGAHQINRRA